MTTQNVVYIVHAVDTEGPLYESTQAKFDRLQDLFGISGIEPTQRNLTKLRNREIDLAGREDDVARVLSGHLTTYNDTWDKIDVML